MELPMSDLAAVDPSSRSPADPAAGDLAHIDAVRAFSRLYTRVMGVLEEGLHGSPFPLPEARLLYELGERGTARAGDLARDLRLDPGYVSRLVRQLEAKGALDRRPNAGDARQLDLVLTDAGDAHYRRNVEAARAMVGGLVARLDATARRTLVSRLAEVATLLDPDADPATIAGGGAGSRSAAAVLRPHRPGDMGWVVESQSAYYARRFGWDARYEALVAEIVATFLRRFDPLREACWIAERAGERLGSIFVVAETAEVARLRLLYLDPAARGAGLGRLMVETAIAFSRAKGYRVLRLWTQARLVEARGIYAALGFVKTGESAHADFGPAETGESWDLAL
jgi:DNA-binding MarR family transcriptional regulator/GNAT superfamily N-acetyltransferase